MKFNIDPREIENIVSMMSEARCVSVSCSQSAMMLATMTENQANEKATVDLGRHMGHILASEMGHRSTCITRMQLPEARESLCQHPYEIEQRAECYVMSRAQWETLSVFLVQLLRQRDRMEVAQTSFDRGMI